MANDHVEVGGSRIRETDLALLWETVEGEQVWLPLSQVEAIHVDKLDVGRVTIPRWLATEKGLI